MSTVEGAVDARDAALRTLFDDASTFPPRRVDLEGALAAHVGIRAAAHAGVVARFMVASDQAPQLAALVPGRTRNPGTGVVEHGIRNLLGAAALAHRGADLGAIRAAVELPIEQIRLGPGALVVGAEVLDSDVVEDARRDLLHTISCADFDEPIRELTALGALGAAGAAEARP